MTATAVAAHHSASSSVVAPAGRLKGKVALITGGTRGVGLAVAKAYIAEGAKVIVSSPNSAELKTTLAFLKEMGGEATGIKTDLSSADACDALYTAALRSYGNISILVNHASTVGPQVPIVDYPVDDWATTMKLNLDAVFWMSKYSLSSMIPTNSGSIINVTSSLALQGKGGWGAYSVSKAAVENLSQVLSEEVAKYNVRVNCIDPGTPDAKSDSYLNPFVYLASDVSRGVTGQHLDAADWAGRSF